MTLYTKTSRRTSAFLQKINEEFFRPRGLFCLVMTWNPESSYQVEQVNLTSTIESRSKSQTGLAGLQSKYRSSDGQTFGELQFPEVAPLIFPALDQLAAQTSAEGVKKKNKMAKGMTFVANYWDKRATAEYVCRPLVQFHCKLSCSLEFSTRLAKILTACWQTSHKGNSALVTPIQTMPLQADLSSHSCPVAI